MDSDGTDQRELTDGAARDEDPAWSPDGTRLAFRRGGDVWAMNADGSGPRNLTRTVDFTEIEPAWSPDGNGIAYTRVGCEVPRGGGNCVYVMNADGTGPTNLTPEDNVGPPCPPAYVHNGTSSEPTWSPDGERIAFTGSLICPNYIGRDIWVMNANGSGKVNLIDDQGTADERAAFSPDGTKIVFISDRDNPNGGSELYVMNVAPGARITRLTTSTGRDETPDWGPGQPTCTKTVAADNAPLVGTAGDDVLCGDARDNVLNGGGGDDVLLGFGGNDTLVGYVGRDTLNGGAGVDTASFAAAATGVDASLVRGFAQRIGSRPVEGVALVGIENLTGSAQADVLSGSAVANELVGGRGGDRLLGLAGNDSLNARDATAGNDTVDGGPGTDRCTTDATEAAVRGCESGQRRAAAARPATTNNAPSRAAATDAASTRQVAPRAAPDDADPAPAREVKNRRRARR